MTRAEAWDLVQSKVKSNFLLNHLLASEAVMKALAEHFHENIDQWGLAGLLHDIDWGVTESEPDKHSLLAAEWLALTNLDSEVIYAIKAHNHRHKLEFKSLLDKALFCAEELTGLIMACAFVQPDKKLASVKESSVKKKFKDKSFAAGVDREIIKQSETLIGLSLDDLIKIELNAMQGIAGDLGL